MQDRSKALKEQETRTVNLWNIAGYEIVALLTSWPVML